MVGTKNPSKVQEEAEDQQEYERCASSVTWKLLNTAWAGCTTVRWKQGSREERNKGRARRVRGEHGVNWEGKKIKK